MEDKKQYQNNIIKVDKIKLTKKGDSIAVFLGQNIIFINLKYLNKIIESKKAS